MLFFGYIGLINLVALAPVLLLVVLTHAVSLADLSAGILGLVVAKGKALTCRPLNILSLHMVMASSATACKSSGLFCLQDRSV